MLRVIKQISAMCLLIMRAWLPNIILNLANPYLVTKAIHAPIEMQKCKIWWGPIHFSKITQICIWQGINRSAVCGNWNMHNPYKTELITIKTYGLWLTWKDFLANEFSLALCGGALQPLFIDLESHHGCQKFHMLAAILAELDTNILIDGHW